MDDVKVRCQSCGMPLEIGLYGTNADGTANSEYCKICMEKGVFREPKLTLNQMTARTIAAMIDNLNMSREDAENLATSVVPNLKRWKMKV